jgi:hypothetical protein
MNKSTYSRPVNFVVLSRQQLMHCAIYVVHRCSRDGAVADFLAVIYVRIWWCSARAVGCVRQHCRAKYCYGFCGAHKCVWPGAVVEEQHLTTLVSWDKLYTKATIQTSACCNITAEFYYYSLGKTFTISLFFSSQKNYRYESQRSLQFLPPWWHYMAQLCRLPFGFGFRVWF